MRVLICGSRTFTEQKIVFDYIEQNLSSRDIVMHGACATGADRLADRACKIFAIPVERYPANWVLHGKGAGPLRNQFMIDQKPNLVVAFWDGESTGTLDTLNRTVRRCIPFSVYWASDVDPVVRFDAMRRLDSQRRLF